MFSVDHYENLKKDTAQYSNAYLNKWRMLVNAAWIESWACRLLWLLWYCGSLDAGKDSTRSKQSRLGRISWIDRAHCIHCDVSVSITDVTIQTVVIFKRSFTSSECMLTRRRHPAVLANGFSTTLSWQDHRWSHISWKQSWHTGFSQVPQVSTHWQHIVSCQSPQYWKIPFRGIIHSLHETLVPLFQWEWFWLAALSITFDQSRDCQYNSCERLFSNRARARCKEQHAKRHTIG